MNSIVDFLNSTWGNYLWFDVSIFVFWTVLAIGIVVFTVRKYKLKFPPFRPLFLFCFSFWITGMVFGGFYAMIWYFDHHAFVGLREASNWEFTYFSFVTITTLGYGDVQPVSYLARWLAVFEACVGLFFGAVLIAILIGQKKPRRRKSS